MGDAHAQIDTFIDKGDEPVQQHQRDINRGEFAHEVHRDRQDMHAAEHLGRGQGQETRRLRASIRRTVLQLSEFGQRPARLLKIALPGLGQRHRAGRARQQTGRQPILQRRDRAGHGRRRSPQPARRSNKAALFGYRYEDRERVQAVHGIIPISEIDFTVFRQLCRKGTQPM